MITRCLTLLLVGSLAGPALAAAPDVDAILASRNLDQGLAALQDHLKQNPKDDNARFGLGAVQFVGSLHNLADKLATYGPIAYGNEDLENVLGDRPAPAEPLTYARLRQIAQEWIDDLAMAEKTLAEIESDDVKLALHVSRIPLTSSRAGLQSITMAPLIQLSPAAQRPDGNDIVVAFDRADVDWLRGYCHLLTALGEINLAYDAHELFDVFGHRVFEHVKTPYPFLRDPDSPRGGSLFQFESIVDLIAAIHVLRFPVSEPKRMEAALAHLEQTLGFSRRMWHRILAETDDDREWIPNPKQKGAFEIRLSKGMVHHWTIALDESEAILKGRKLLPFWRGKEKRGLNLRKVFLDPPTLDLVLWIQGTAASPYLEEGELTDPETWDRINTVFQGQFLAYGLWFN